MANWWDFINSAEAAPTLNRAQRAQELLKAQEQKRSIELLREQETARQQEAARQAEALRQQEEAKRQETARQEQQKRLELEIQQKNFEQQRGQKLREQQDIADALKKERETPFRVAHPMLSAAMPLGVDLLGMGAASGANLLRSRKLGKNVKDWKATDEAAMSAYNAGDRDKALLAADRLKDFQAQWPEMEKRLTSGGGTAAAAALGTGFGSLEAAMLPTELDYTYLQGTPNEVSNQDWLEALKRAVPMSGLGALAGWSGSKIGPTRVSPYVGGAGTLNSIARKFPKTPQEASSESLSDIAEALRSAGPPTRPTSPTRIPPQMWLEHEGQPQTLPPEAIPGGGGGGGMPPQLPPRSEYPYPPLVLPPIERIEPPAGGFIPGLQGAPMHSNLKKVMGSGDNRSSYSIPALNRRRAQESR